MPDSQSSEPGFESPFATVSKIGHVRSLHWRPSWLSCINEYLAIDSGENVSDLVVARNCCIARMLPGKAELVPEWTGLTRRAKNVKRFELSNGLDTALYKNYLYLYNNLSRRALASGKVRAAANDNRRCKSVISAAQWRCLAWGGNGC